MFSKSKYGYFMNIYEQMNFFFRIRYIAYICPQTEHVVIQMIKIHVRG